MLSSKVCVECVACALIVLAIKPGHLYGQDASDVPTAFPSNLVGVPLRSDVSSDLFSGRRDVVSVLRDDKYLWSLTQFEPCVRRFDGFETFQRDLPGSCASCMAIDGRDRVWIGASGEVIVVLPSDTGSPLEGKCVRVPITEERVDNCKVVGNAVYARTRRGVYRIRLTEDAIPSVERLTATSDKNLRILTQGEFRGAYVIGTTDGIFSADTDGLLPVPGYEGRSVYSICELDDGRLFTLMSDESFHLNSYIDGMFIQKVRERPSFVLHQGGSDRLSDGRIVLPMNVGVGIFHPKGQLEIFVPMEAATYVFVDDFDVIWVASSNGVQRLHGDIERSTLSEENGLPSKTVFFLPRADGAIVLDDKMAYHFSDWSTSTAQGRLEELHVAAEDRTSSDDNGESDSRQDNEPDNEPDYEPDNEPDRRDVGQVTDAIVQDGRVWICSSNGVFHVEDDRLRVLDTSWDDVTQLEASGGETDSTNDDGSPRVFCRSRTDGKIVYYWQGVERSGITITDPITGQTNSHPVNPPCNQAARRLPVQGRTPNLLWMLTSAESNGFELSCYVFGETWDIAPSHYVLTDRVHTKSARGDYLGIGRTNAGQVLVATGEGVLAVDFNAEHQRIDFDTLWSWDYEPDDEARVHFGSGKTFVVTNSGLDVWENGELMLREDVYSDLSIRQRHYEQPALSLRTIETEGNRFAICKNGIVYIGNIRSDGPTSLTKDAQTDLRLKVRLELGQLDDPLNRWPGKDQVQSIDEFTVDASTSRDDPITIPYGSSVRVQVAVSELFHEARNRFQFQLLKATGGTTEEWTTQWQSSNATTCRLDSGRYELAVRGRGIHDFGQLTIPIHVTRPWYQTALAKVSFALAGCVGLLGLLRWRRATVQTDCLNQDLCHSENRFQAIFQTSPDAILTTDDELRIVHANSTALSLLDACDLDDVGGKPLTNFVRFDEAEQTKNVLRRKLLRRSNGTSIFVELRRIGGTTGTQWHLRDLTSQDEMKLQLERSAAVEAMGLMAGSIAHDFRNVLGAVTLTNDILQSRESVQSDSDAMEAIQVSIDAVESGTRLASRLMKLGAPSSPSSEATDLCEIARNVHRAFARQYPDVSLDLIAPDAAVNVVGAAEQIMRCLVNIYDNAIKEVEGDDGASVATSIEVVGQKRIGSSRSVDISVRDNGQGIDENIRKKIFQPYVSTRFDQGGTGLGLYSVKEIMASVEGDISVESAVGEGTCFTLHLKPAGETPIIQEKRLTGLRVLVVDDDARFQAATGASLRLLGAEVSGTTDPMEAVSLLQNNHYDALITDFSMEPIDGLGVAQAARRCQKQCMVVLVTAYTDFLERGGLFNAELVDHALPKPVSAAKIVDAIASKRPKQGADGSRAK